MENKPLMSIIIPCYNDAQYIEESVFSALNQTYPYKEIIVVDDGSNAVTKAVLKKLESRITKLITQENQGQSTARNVGISAAKGEYILVLDSDDYFEPTFCAKAIVKFDNNTIKLVTSFINRFNENKKIDVYYPKGGDINVFILNNQASGSAMFRKKDFNAIEGYDEFMRSGFEDWEFYIRLLKDGGIAYVIPEILFYYRLKENSTTSKANKIKYELLNYIYSKHRELYITHFDTFIPYLLTKTKSEENEKIKNTKRIEFKIGETVLQPFRWIKSIFK